MQTQLSVPVQPFACHCKLSLSIRYLNQQTKKASDSDFAIFNTSSKHSTTSLVSDYSLYHENYMQGVVHGMKKGKINLL